MEEVVTMRIYCYKESTVDCSNMTLEEIEEEIKKEHEKAKNQTWEEIIEEFGL